MSLNVNKYVSDNYRTLSQVTKMYEIGELLMWARTRHIYQTNLNPSHMGFIPGSGSTNGQLLAQEVLVDAKEESKTQQKESFRES